VTHRSTSLYSLPSLILALIVGLSYIGLGFLGPLYALYGREIGATNWEIGLMSSAFLLAGFIATPAIGWLADRFGPRLVLSVGLFLHALIILCYIPLRSPSLIIGLRALEGVATMAVLPPARALINSLAPPHRQGEALGLLSTAQVTGILIGPAAGTLLAAQFGYLPPFIIAGVTLTVCAGLALWVLPKPEGDRSGGVVLKAQPWRALFSPPLNLAYLLRLTLAIAHGLTIAIWSLYMQDRGASLPVIGLSFTAFAVSAIGTAPLAGRLSDRYGRYWLTWGGFVLTGLVYCGYSLPLSPLWLVGLSLVDGLASTTARSAVDGLLADHTPTAARGRIQATFSAAHTAGAFFGASVAGLFYAVDPGRPFLIHGLLCLSLAVALLTPALARLFSARLVKAEVEV
jgi:MFS family permease